MEISFSLPARQIEVLSPNPATQIGTTGRVARLQPHKQIEWEAEVF